MANKPTISELANMIPEDPRDPGAELADRLQERGEGAQPLEGAVVSFFPKGAQPGKTAKDDDEVLQIDFGGYTWNARVPRDEFVNAWSKARSGSEFYEH